MTTKLVSALFLLTFSAVSNAQLSDMPGSSDYPDLPRIDGTVIVGYKQSPFDEGQFIKESTGHQFEVDSAQGIRTRIVYVGEEGMSTLQIIKNYQVAFSNFGDFKKKYECAKARCPRAIGKNFIWQKANRVPVSFNSPSYLYLIDRWTLDSAYLFGTIEQDGALYSVAVFTARNLDKRTNLEERPFVHLEIIKQEDFEPTLVVLDAKEISNEIHSSGSVSIYGIKFDYDSANITAESDESIAELALAMTSDTSLNIFVVGHTDNQGALRYNQDLSLRRAEAVVSRLGANGVAAQRMQPVGIGQVAPLASNDTAEGQAKNRRVEIVKQ